MTPTGCLRPVLQARQNVPKCPGFEPDDAAGALRWRAAGSKLVRRATRSSAAGHRGSMMQQLRACAAGMMDATHERRRQGGTQVGGCEEE